MTPKVAIIRQRYSAFGGGEQIIRQAAEAMVRLGHAEVTIVSREWSDQHRPEGVRFLKCDPWHAGRLLRELTFFSAARRATRDGFDLVQSHERMPGTDVYRAGDGVYREWIAHYSAVLPPWRRALVRLSAFHAVALRLEKAIYSAPRLRAVIANSELVAHDIVKHFPHVASKITVIRNGVDCHRFHPGLRDAHRGEVLARHRLPESSRVLLFLGSGWVRKGLGTAMMAMRGLPSDVVLIVVGRDKRHSEFVELSARLGLAGRVVFAGPRSDPHAYLGACDALVLPSIYDPMPNSVLEAMAAGVPVTVSSHTGARDIVRDGIEGFVRDPHDVEGWTDALSSAVAAGARERMGSAGRRCALLHSMDSMAGKWTELYRRLLA